MGYVKFIADLQYPTVECTKNYKSDMMFLNRLFKNYKFDIALDVQYYSIA